VASTPSVNYNYDNSSTGSTKGLLLSITMISGGSTIYAESFSYDQYAYAYDAENRMASVDGGSTGQYFYDCQNRRVKKVVARQRRTTRGKAVRSCVSTTQQPADRSSTTSILAADCWRKVPATGLTPIRRRNLRVHTPGGGR
jgi:hypothetical protein